MTVTPFISPRTNTVSLATKAGVPITMNAVLFYQPGDIRYEVMPTPLPGPGEVLMAVDVALTDGTDLKTYRRGHPVLLTHFPSPFGHECCGRVVAVGEGVKGFKVGDRVVPANSAPCDTCYYCMKNQPNLCESLALLNGAYADYLKIPADIVVKNMVMVPDHVPSAIAAFCEPLSVALRGLDAAQIQPGDTVAVLGLGSIGQLLSVLARQRGAKTVVGFARSASKRELARQFAGINHTVTMDNDQQWLNVLTTTAQDWTPKGIGFDVVIEAIGQPLTWEAALKLVRRGGRVCWFGGCPAGSSVQLDTRQIHYDEITLVSPFHHTPHYFREAMALLASKQLDPSPLITHQKPLDQLAEAFELMESGQALKVAITP